MKILILGGFGYLGLNLAAYLSKDYEVILYGKKAIKGIEYKYIEADVFDENKLLNSLEGIDFVLNLIALPANECELNPNKAKKINVESAKIISKIINQSKVKKAIFFSTFHVYGKYDGKITEKIDPKPIGEYGKTKLQAEKYWQLETGTEFITLRLSNSYGAPKSKNGWNLVINDLCKQAKENGKIILNSSGIQKRDFVSIKDVARAVKLIIESHEKLEKIYNLGGEQSFGIGEIAQKIAEKYHKINGKHIEIEIKNNADEKESNLEYDISKIKQLGFKPSKDIDSEIEKIIKELK